jgi:carboxymethylenebutenolidase
MSVVAKWTRTGSDLGYLAWQARALAPLPAVLVIQEIWGVDNHIQDVTRRLAAAGYLAYAPDLYATNGVRPEGLLADRIVQYQDFLATLPSTVTTPDQRAAAIAALPYPAHDRLAETHQLIYSGLGRLDRHLPALERATRYLRRDCDLSAGQKVACVGFCMGGSLAGLLATSDPELAGAAVFYGAAPPVDKVSSIACPVLGFYAGLDDRINAGLPAFTAAAAAAGKDLQTIVYPNTKHGFFNDDRPAYDVGAARDSFTRLLTFLRARWGP